MAKRFFTSDLHFNSEVLIDKKMRPFKTVEQMNKTLITNINQRCKPDDILIHCGDFIQYGNDRGYKGNKIHPFEYISKIKPMFVNIQGNHDDNNKMKSVCSSMRTTLGRKYLSVSVGHYPSTDPRAKNTFRMGDVRLCGHVHGNWKYFIDFENKVLNINVGVDVWNYNPVSEDELIIFIDRIMKTTK
jgi:calcineurin-like phosphoesterase family protein